MLTRKLTATVVAGAVGVNVNEPAPEWPPIGGCKSQL
jgi:hypothetical protein